MDGINPDEVEFVLKQIQDGFIFEKFASSFLSAVIGNEFIPHGGIKDKGIDGLEHIFYKKDVEKHLYQLSIEKNPLTKAMSTLVKLNDNKIDFDQFTFVTNQFFKEKDQFTDEAFNKFKKPLRIFDTGWFQSNINHSPATVTAFKVFIDSYLHEFNKPGKSYVIGDLVSDPRLFVFLRQQWDSSSKDMGLDKILADTLIILALEGTDPDKKIVCTEEQIFSSIKARIKFDPKLLHAQVLGRLTQLTKEKKIQLNKQLNGYCLPFITREQIRKRNIEDSAIHDKFKQTMGIRLKRFLKDADIVVKDCVVLIEEVLNKIFRDQGMEFSDFILKDENPDAIEKMLPDIISKSVDTSSVVNKNKEGVKNALLMTIRDVIYNGTIEEKEFLRKLSNTYMLLFLVQCDPKVSMFFTAMASKLNIYVCTSIIIPALSEYYLDPINRRHWNLLAGAHEAGVRLIINKTILEELIAHFKHIAGIFEIDYKNNEGMYRTSNDLLIINEIMIRAYFYSHIQGQTSSFSDFIENFVSFHKITDGDIGDDLISFLKSTFGIEYLDDKSINVEIDKTTETKLVDNLSIEKYSVNKARNDAHIILTIYALREKRNERSERGIFGYQTWWLSKDIKTYKALKIILNTESVSCYMRPDFLYNYICLAPKSAEVDEAFKHMFPTLVGVNVSFHLPQDVTNFVHQQIKEHNAKNPARLQASLGELCDRLASDPHFRSKTPVKHFLEEKLKT